MSEIRYAPYSLQYVHCGNCLPCADQDDCLKNDVLRKKSIAAIPRDDLKKHTNKNHPKVFGDRQTKLPFKIVVHSEI